MGEADRVQAGTGRVIEWRQRLGVEPSHPAHRGTRPILKTGRATGPRSLPLYPGDFVPRTPLHAHSLGAAPPPSVRVARSLRSLAQSDRIARFYPRDFVPRT